MRKLLALLLAVLVLAQASAPARADSSAGSASFDFLNFDGNARSVGLGGAYTALATDSSALLYNPAGLARVRAHEATFMHNAYAQGLTQEYLGFASRQGFGFQLNTANMGDIQRTTLSQPGGTGSTFGVNDLAVGAGYGRDLGEAFSVGVGGKFIRESIDNVAATGGAADFGALYRVAPVSGLTFGASLLNVGPDVKFLVDKEHLPTTGRVGAAYAFPALGSFHTATIDFTEQRSDKLRMGVGLESVLGRQFAIRGGFTTRNDAGIGLSGGVGWQGKNFAADYAFVPMGDLGLTHRLSITVRWGSEQDDRHARQLDDRVLYYVTLGSDARDANDCRTAKAHYVEAIKLASELERKDAIVADAYTGIGLCLVSEGKNELAVRFFKRSLDISSSSKLSETARREATRLQTEQPAQ